ncbi:YggT family protein [Qipengyuania gelatinilytica]|uniref:YggT family protein n=1 Tax=Qipengyuania gelatinilytica TaxID=2867231 RepID=A0ABX9A3M5_9SPHN|nr:YggT family protein [Qipengyuania gelatinilytica]QZD93918.1 YggT family protein [Qipengyuania gelatinilytica]
MKTLIDILIMIMQTLNMIVIVWFIIGLLFAFNVVDPRQPFLSSVYDSISRLLAPLLNPIRRMIPDTGAIDFSPMILLMGMWIIIRILVGMGPY